MRRSLAAAPIVLLLAATASAAGGPTAVATIAVPATAQPCAAAAAGRFVWVSAFGAPYLMRIDPQRNVVVGRTTVGSGACGLGVGAGSLWIEDTYSATVSRVSVRSGKRISVIEVGASPYDATFAFGAAWATVHGGGQLVRVDPATNRVAARVPLGQATGVVGAYGSVWATGADGLVRIDPRTNAVVARIALPMAGWTAAGQGAVWITGPTGLSRIDPQTNTVSATIAIPGNLGDPAVVGGRVWVPRIRANRIAIVDPATNSVVGSVEAGAGPFVVTEIHGEAWVPSWRGTDVRRFRP
jgi:DNA-binding beta-propeller fold protein YncE